MKKLFVTTLLCMVFVAARSQVVNKLYYSKQTGEYSSYQGSYAKTTDNYETGTMTLTTTGPVAYSVTPSGTTIGTNTSKSWAGKVFPDAANAPAPGSSANATLSGDYVITYSRPQGASTTGTVTSTHQCGGCPTHAPNRGTHELVRQTGNETVNFIVHSLDVDVIDSKNTCPGKTVGVIAQGYPAGGKYKWIAGNNTTITNGENDSLVEFKNNAVGNGTITVRYSVGGVSCSKTIQLVCANPTVKVNVPDTMLVAINQRVTITPVVTPTGVSASAQWTVPSDLTLNSGPYNFVAFITVKGHGAQFRTVTLRATVCGTVITKNIVLKVNPCAVDAPEEVVVLKNVDETITATGNMPGNYAWTAGADVQIQGAANQQAVKIKGTNAGTSWAEVTFTSNAGCKATKRVKVEIINSPRLTVTVGYSSNTTVCKGERKILTAQVQPAGGTFNWTISSNVLKFYGASGNQPNVVVEADHGGTSTVTCSYTYGGQTVTETVNFTVNHYSKVEVTASNTASELLQGTAVTYTATVYDNNGQVTAAPALQWKVVYIPLGQENNAWNWVSYDLSGTGTTQTYRWSFPQGSFPLPGVAPFKMQAWIEATEYCTYHSGSVHFKVIKN
jgi:hypothetical protein